MLRAGVLYLFGNNLEFHSYQEEGRFFFFYLFCNNLENHSYHEEGMCFVSIL